MRFLSLLPIGLLAFLSCERHWSNPVDPETSAAIPWVELRAPQDRSITGKIHVDLNWSEAQYASGYQVQIAADNDFASVKVDTDRVETTFSTPPLRPDATWYWRVRPRFGRDGYKG
ncbi:hypothetical protein JW992_07870, partial [candidate division KSB1 bacterium]|nr:hypothetical protein [candidate division KSB1 bacterium]